MRTLLWVCLLVTLSVGVSSAQAPAPQKSTLRHRRVNLSCRVIPRHARRYRLTSATPGCGLYRPPRPFLLERLSFSVYRANFDRKQGLTDVGEFGITGAIGLGRAELFGSWRVGRFDRNIQPVFVPIGCRVRRRQQRVPIPARSLVQDTRGADCHWREVRPPVPVARKRDGARAACDAQVPEWRSDSGQHEGVSRHRSISSRAEKMGGRFELSASGWLCLPGRPRRIRVSDGFRWGLGAGFPSRSALRVLLELEGEVPIDDAVVVNNPPFVALDGSIAPISSDISNNTAFKAGLVWQSAGAECSCTPAPTTVSAPGSETRWWRRLRSERMGLRRAHWMASGRHAARRM